MSALCGEAQYGSLGYQHCIRDRGHAGLTHRSQDGLVYTHGVVREVRTGRASRNGNVPRFIDLEDGRTFRTETDSSAGYDAANLRAGDGVQLTLNARPEPRVYRIHDVPVEALTRAAAAAN